MIWFILFYISGMILCLRIMKQKRIKTKEKVIFIVIAFLGFIDWIGIFLDYKFKPTKLIATILDWVGL